MLTHATRSRRLPIALVAALSAVLAVVAFAPAARADTTRRGCPPLALCIYPNASWNNNHPSAVYRFGSQDHASFDLHNQYGVHRVFDNSIDPQYGLYASLNRNYHGGGPVVRWIYEDQSFDINLTPVNSVTVWLDQRTTT